MVYSGNPQKLEKYMGDIFLFFFLADTIPGQSKWDLLWIRTKC